MHLSIDDSLHFSDLSFGICDQLALCSLNLLISLLFEVHQLLLCALAEPAEQLLAKLLDQGLIRVTFNNLLKHGPLPLVVLEYERLLLFEELLLFCLT